MKDAYPNYDYSKLRGRITEKLGSLKNYAESLHLSDTAVSNKLKNKTAFSQDEILESIKKEVLDIPKEEIALYFFTQNGKLHNFYFLFLDVFHSYSSVFGIFYSNML